MQSTVSRFSYLVWMGTLLNDWLENTVRRVLINAHVFQLGHANLQKHFFDLNVRSCQRQQSRCQYIFPKRCSSAEENLQEIDQLPRVVWRELQDEIVRKRFPSVDDGVLK